MTSNLGKTQLKRHCRRPVNYDESVDSMDQSVDSMDQSSSSAESDDESSKLHNEQETVTVPGKRTIRRRSRKLDQKTSATTAVEGYVTALVVQCWQTQSVVSFVYYCYHLCYTLFPLTVVVNNVRHMQPSMLVCVATGSVNLSDPW